MCASECRLYHHMRFIASKMACLHRSPATPANLTVLLTLTRNKTTRVQEWKDTRRFEVKINPDMRPVEETSTCRGFKWMDVRWKNKNKAETLIHSLAIDESRRSDPREARKISDAKLQALMNSLRGRGFRRERKAYNPPENLEQIIRKALESAVLSKPADDSWLSFPLTDNQTKFRFLMLCATQLDHMVPNSDLYLMKTVRDVFEFYKEPIRDLMTFDHLVREQQRDELPANLHLVPDVHVYDPDSEFMGGINAFPGNPDTRLLGVRDRLRYPSKMQSIPWPDI